MARLSPLCIGVMVACFRTPGISPVFSDSLQIWYIEYANVCLQFLSNLAEKPSGPGDELGDIAVIASMMSSSVK